MEVTDIIERLGGAALAAQKLGVKRTTICMWRNKGRVPPVHVPRVAHALGVAPEVVWPALALDAPQPRQEAA